MKKEWYVVNTVSGHEYKVKEKLEMRINSMDLQENIFRVIVRLCFTINLAFFDASNCRHWHKEK